jgi:hypothetical protein
VVVVGVVVGANVAVGGALVLDVVKGVGKKGLKVVVGVREGCGTSTVVTDWLVVGVVEVATESARVVLVISVVVGASVGGTSVTGTLVVGAIVVLVVVGSVDVVVGTHVVVGVSVVVEEVVVGNSGWVVVVDTSGGSDVVTSVVVVVFTGFPLKDNSY